MRTNKQCIILVIFYWAFLIHGEIYADGRKCILPEQDFKEFSDCIKRGNDGELYLASKYFKKLSFGENGLAAVYSQEEGWMYVNRKGKVIITGVATMDNFADVFHDGLVRFSKYKKWGFADEKGKVIIPAIYDGALNFEKGLAKVCTGCRPECAGSDCEHHSFAGGEWFYINTKGEIVKKAILKEGSYE